MKKREKERETREKKQESKRQKRERRKKKEKRREKERKEKKREKKDVPNMYPRGSHFYYIFLSKQKGWAVFLLGIVS